MPADRFFGAASEVRQTLPARVAANALELARHGVPKTPFYLTGQVGGQPFSVHAEGERVILTRAEGARQRLRTHVVDLCQWTQAQGWRPAAIAELLRLAPRTLRQWCCNVEQARLRVSMLGRPVLRGARRTQ